MFERMLSTHLTRQASLWRVALCKNLLTALKILLWFWMELSEFKELGLAWVILWRNNSKLLEHQVKNDPSSF